MTITAAFITENGIHVPHAVVSDREALINRIEANERELRRLGAERLRLYTGAPAEHDALLLTAAEDAASGDAGVGPRPGAVLASGLAAIRAQVQITSHAEAPFGLACEPRIGRRAAVDLPRRPHPHRSAAEPRAVYRSEPASPTALVDAQARSPT
ncbi:hypothetical protein [Leucobacter sp. W1478]|uniref:hypothetical protein n=1 Tax=Leucobacter sp. W1478 TaxID=3439065 RepID=UPI003F354946